MEYVVDKLTGLLDMESFQALAQSKADGIAAQGGRPVMVALDLIGLKSYNTRHGREAGDDLLRAFGSLLMEHFGADSCARFSEDHFYVITTCEELENRLQEVFESFITVNGLPALPVRAGVCECSAQGETAIAAIDRARIACDYDRKTWKSHLTWFDEEMKEASQMRIYVLEHVDRAIDEGWIRPYYQSIVRASTGNVCAEEALARWHDPLHGTLQPARFVPVLEEAGLLHKVDMHIVDCVLGDIVKKREAGVVVVPVSINLSHRDLEQFNVMEEVRKRADAMGVSHELLKIEFTETAASANPWLLSTQVDALHREGFGVWMDDFGSGFSSLNTLHEHDFDLIKIDMGFLDKVSTTEKARNIIAGVVRTAEKMRLHTLTEGVETEEQAIFLEGIGCSMLQGFYYASPRSIESVIDDALSGKDITREEPVEARYWNAIAALSLNEPSLNYDSPGDTVEPPSEFPVGVIEHRAGKWSLLRSNHAYRDSLDRSGILPENCSSLKANTFELDVDDAFEDAVSKALENDSWEIIASRVVDNSGFQFYIRPVACSSEAEAFMLVATPTMLGSALGAYGDVPIGYAVFRVQFNETGTDVVDAEYVFANKQFCEWTGLDMSTLVGRRFLRANRNASPQWFPLGYRSAVLGEEIHGTMFSPEIGHWVHFNIAPSPVKDCCVFAFALADDEHRERQAMRVDRDTSDLIIEITSLLDAEEDYDKAMNGALSLISGAIHPERLFIYERGEQFTRNTFVWCSDGTRADSRINAMVPNTEFDAWKHVFDEQQLAVIPDIETMKGISEHLYDELVQNGVTHLLAVPLYDNGKLVGTLGADNYEFDESIDARRLLKTIAPYIGSRIVIHNLLLELEWSVNHDGLTGLLSRTGLDNAIHKRLDAHPDDPFVLALLDLDDFKVINDSYGHVSGDKTLKELSRALQGAFSQDAIVGRNGGDEFLVMLFGDSAAKADELFERFLQLDFGFDCAGKHISPTVSIGYVEYPKQARSLEEAYTQADVALYSVKLAGKSGCKRY